MTGVSTRHIWTIAWPIMISLVMEYMISLTDTAFLGRVGEVELGASAIAGVYYLGLYVLSFGFSMGAQILIGRRNGENKHHAIGPLVVQGNLFLLLLTVVLVAITILFAPILLQSSLSSPQIAEAAQDYLRWRIYGLFPVSCALMCRAFYVGITQTRILTYSALLMVITNVILNYLLIFGMYGFPRLGIAGAAIASSLSELVSLLFYAGHIFFRVDRVKYGITRQAFRCFAQIPAMLSISIWTMLQYFAGISVWLLFFIAVEHLGERPIAISNIVRSVSTLLFMPINSVAAAASTLVSNQIGAQRPDLVLPISKRAVFITYACLLPIILFLFFFPRLILYVYTDNADLIESAIPSLRVMSSSLLVGAPACILFNIVSGTGNTRTAMLMDFVAFAIYALYCYIIVTTLKLDIAICWTAEYSYWIPLFCFGFFYLRSNAWRGKKI